MSCPRGHIWAFDEGKKCCYHFQPNLNLATMLMFSDLVGECRDGDYIPCPDLERLCTNGKSELGYSKAPSMSCTVKLGVDNEKALLRHAKLFCSCQETSFLLNWL